MGLLYPASSLDNSTINQSLHCLGHLSPHVSTAITLLFQENRKAVRGGIVEEQRQAEEAGERRCRLGDATTAAAQAAAAQRQPGPHAAGTVQ